MVDKNEKKKGFYLIINILIYFIVFCKNVYRFYFRYEKHLDDAKKHGIKKGAINGITMGTVWFLIYCAYALGI